MTQRRINFQNWIVELGFDPNRGPEEIPKYDVELKLEIEARINEAMDGLSENEREFIRQFYYFGRTYVQIAGESGRRVHKLEALHDRAMRKLRTRLAPFVKERFGVEEEPELLAKGKRPRFCSICESEYRAEIDEIIAGRDPKETWRPVIKELRERFGIRIKSPQQLIGHEKYH